jgi:hypothetical protein
MRVSVASSRGAVFSIWKNAHSQEWLCYQNAKTDYCH